MGYTAPKFVEIKMDAEVGSYQDDFEFDPQRGPSTPDGLLLSAPRAVPPTRSRKQASERGGPR